MSTIVRPIVSTNRELSAFSRDLAHALTIVSGSQTATLRTPVTGDEDIDMFCRDVVASLADPTHPAVSPLFTGDQQVDRWGRDVSLALRNL